MRRSKKYNDGFVWSILLILGALVLAIILSSKFSQKPITLGATQSTVRVMVINFNPTVNGQSLSSYKGWNDPTALENQFIQDVNTVSGGNMNYQVVNRVNVDGIPTKQDGFQYTTQTYLDCVNNHSTCHSPDWSNYLKILSDHQVCDKVNNNEIDELWIWGGPWFGYYESIMTGPGAFWTNGGPLIGSTCQRKLNIMGFNYERGVSEMLEDLGHRVEGTMTKVYGGWHQTGTIQNNWDKFSTYNKNRSGLGACGNVHFAPNSTSDYDWGDNSTVTSACDDWLNYPNLSGATKQINCSTWGCDGYGYKKWWLSHLPKGSGFNSDGKLNNWWSYVANYDNAISTVVSPATATSAPVATSTTTTSIATNTPANTSTNTSPVRSTNTKTTTSSSQTQQILIISSPKSQTPTPSGQKTTFTVEESTTSTVIQPTNPIPFITTIFLSIGVVGKPYHSSINGYIVNANDTISVNISGLPDGIIVEPCNVNSNSSKSNIVCPISGTPAKTKLLKIVTVTLTNSAGGQAIKSLFLFTLPKFY